MQYAIDFDFDLNPKMFPTMMGWIPFPVCLRKNKETVVVADRSEIFLSWLSTKNPGI